MDFSFLIILLNVQYFTDPVNNYSFRTRKSAMLYVQTGKVPKRAFIQRTSVHDLYSFEKSADLVTLPQNLSSVKFRFLFKTKQQF